MTTVTPRPLIVGRPVLVVVDIQQSSFMPPPTSPDPSVRVGIPRMPGYRERFLRAPEIVGAAREAGIPVVFFKEVHRRTLVDFGRELDGDEGIHCLDGDPRTEVAAILKVGPDDYVIAKRRYSCFFGTDLEILLKGLQAETLVLIGGLTDVCVHYTFVDAHQHDYVVRVVEDCVSGSSLAAHQASLNAMEYLQNGALRSTDAVIAAFRAHGAGRAAAE